MCKILAIFVVVVVCFGCVFNIGYFDANVSVKKTHNDPILKIYISV